MDHIAHLRVLALVTQRRIFASLSFGQRLAWVFHVLSFDLAETFGKVIYTTFLLRGVTGMPDPGPKWNPKSPSPDRTLPSGYGKQFGHKVRGMLLSKFRDKEFVDEILAEMASMFSSVGKRFTQIEPYALSQAESFVRSAVMRYAMDQLDKASTRRRHEVVLEDREDEDRGGGSQMVDMVDTMFEHNPNFLEDPKVFRSLERTFKPVWPKVLHDLESKVHPDAALYVDLLLDGYDEVAIVGNPNKGLPGMLPHYQQSPQNWQQNIRPKFVKVFTEWAKKLDLIS